MLILNILIITFIITYIIGSSGIVFDLSKFIYNLTHKKEWSYQIIGKPFGCSVCMTFWTILIYTLIIGLSVIYSIGLACTMAIISILIDKLIKKIIEIFNKIK